MLILGGLTALGPLSIDIYLPALPGLARDMRTGTSPTQFSLTACLVGLAGGRLLAGPASDAWGRRRPLLTGLHVTDWHGIFAAIAALGGAPWAAALLRLPESLRPAGRSSPATVSRCRTRCRWRYRAGDPTRRGAPPHCSAQRSS